MVKHKLQFKLFTISFTQVSYEEFKLQFAQMYEHYERHRTDNITDPALRRAHPISTISGWDRERDENASATDARVPPALANGNGGITPSPPPAKISKSEQTDDQDVVGVKCACVESTEDGDSEEHADAKTIDETATKTNGTATEAPAKPVSSISSISQVYNEQLCNGNGHAGASEDDDSMSSPQKETSGSGALRQTLELGDEDIDANATATAAADSMEIVEEIVEEILKKSEVLLDDCKRTLDSENAASSVIKDEEIEHAVSEVVKGVRQIEKKANMQETDAEVKNASDEEPEVTETTTKIPTIDETSQTRNDNQKTDLVLSSSAIVAKINNKQIDADDDGDGAVEAATTNDDDNIEEIVTNIVNEVIDNCVNQTLSRSDVDAIKDGALCDNTGDKTSAIQNDDSINNNNIDDDEPITEPTVTTVTPAANTINDDNDNAIIAESPTPTIQSQAVEVVETVLSEAISATTPDVSVEETSEQIVKSIVNEIIETCVQNVGDDNNNRETTPATEAPAATNDVENEQVVDVDEEKSVVVSDHASEGCPTTAVNRIQGTSISTSTQVENNHFGEFIISIDVERCRNWLIILQIKGSSNRHHRSRPHNQDRNQAQRARCSVQDHRGHRSVFPNSSGRTSINVCSPTFCSHLRLIYK